MEIYNSNQSEGRNSLKDIMKSLDIGEYGIGVHGIDKGSVDDKKEIATTILSEGIKMNGSKTILGTAISLGVNYESGYLANEAANYRFGSGHAVSVVIAAPLCIENVNQDKIFLGFPERNIVRSGQQYQEHCILDRICARLGIIPSEFVLGYFVENEDLSEQFIENPNHYSHLTKEEKEAVYQICLAKLDMISKRFNEMISDGKVKDLEELKVKMIDAGMPTFLVDSAIVLTKKYVVRGKTGTEQKEIWE